MTEGHSDRPAGVDVVGPPVPGADRVLTADALAFVAGLQRRFGAERARLLAARRDRQAAIDAGERPGFLAATADVRGGDWRVAPTPADLLDRRVEITGPAEPKMMINALNSGARVFMADLEDALSPTWANVVGGQAALADAVRRELTFASPDGRTYRLGERIATLLVRPRGWHLDEAHVLVDGAPVSASLFDAGLYLFHNAAERVRRGDTPALYLPKLESHVEARLWNDVFTWTQERLGVPHGSVRATVLIETITAAFEMDEILYELRDHAAGLNAGRWDYLFSIIKRFRRWPSLELPDRGHLTMTTPFMRAYTELLVRTCHRRGAHAIGGMAAFIPNRRDPEVTATAMAKVREDKERESGDGFDGTWVAHPDLVPLATQVFDAVLGERTDQRERLREDVAVRADDLLDVRAPGSITESGVRQDVSVALRYLDAWLRGTGAAAIFNLMEDAATAEISRSQLWLWRTRGSRLADGRAVDAALYRAIRDEELERARADADASGASGASRVDEAAALLDELVLDDDFADFLTLRAYPLLG
ncbi:MAG TPA: malate synthase A [Candidatus Limnocylindrales bacterium]|nr:malate synthase A [Candidatus Limnocylindrales bacterium]